MKKVCIIGSSHVAAYTNAKAQIAKTHPDFSVDYFGVSFPHVEGLACDAKGVYGLDRALAQSKGLRGNRAQAAVQRINERASIDLSQHDAVFYVGHYIKLKDVIRLIAVYDIDGFPDRGRSGLMSRAAFEAMTREIIHDHIPDRLGNMGRATRTWVSIIPLLSSACLEDVGSEYDYLRTVTPDALAIAPIMAWIQQMIGERFYELGITYIQQHPRTTPQLIVTERTYSQGSRVFGETAEEHGARDYLHMNADYAAMCFDDFAEQVRADTPVGPSA